MGRIPEGIETIEIQNAFGVRDRFCRSRLDTGDARFQQN